MKVQILLATYNPDLDQLKKQLASINSQSEKDIELLCCDDCSANQAEVHAALKACITEFKWTFLRNEKNSGCNRTFEKLISHGTARYFAFCDQDDVWHRDKIRELLALMEAENPVLVYSDLQVIDKDDRVVAPSLRSIRKRLSHLSGAGLWRRFLRRNSITGCTMLVEGAAARSALPFPPESVYIWDHWTSIWAAYKGTIAYYPKPTISYRVHAGNLVGAKKLVGIQDRETYIANRIDKELVSLQFALGRLEADKQAGGEIASLISRVYARRKFLAGPTIAGFSEFLMSCFRDPLLLLFEFVLAVSPDNGSLIIGIARKSLF